MGQPLAKQGLGGLNSLQCGGLLLVNNVSHV
jgi:hypothetical protein